ncbi:DAK2 domain-containing protein [Lactococcus petauri]|nr:DAK2 domain-containing protein [Lactococcus petauri]MDC0815105.1 DAK2 domain-containing protein [Lactococcus petauri]MDC0817174.1 DAK2 domain-containing protein [Lactococcus petauri]MDC0823592.1 DAK2 domain-containing protein [Lactococcus petauri]MDC0829694.1 DAK2 domain-containing protein [Lactococcus petauri]
MGEKNENYRLLQSFRAGAEKVILQKEELNKINVFPVADGDTGSNLASLMQAIIDNVPMKNYPMDILLDEISAAALIGARGNSGIIFAQYLSAVAENYQKAETNFESFVEALEQAVNKAYSSLIDPKEGTILTVMRAWSITLEKIID